MFCALLSPWSCYLNTTDAFGDSTESWHMTGWGMGSRNPSPAVLPDFNGVIAEGPWSAHVRNLGG